MAEAVKLEYTDIIVDKKYPIGYITLNRPEKRNALSSAKGSTIEQLQQAFFEMRDDPEIRVFIIKGAGDCFCAGFDLGRYDEGIFKPVEEIPKAVEWVKNVQNEAWSRFSRKRGGDLSNPEAQSLGAHHSPFWEGLWENPKFSIAQVHSFCLGAGLWMANECDIVYSTPTAIFGYPPVRYGSSVVLGILPPWLLGRKKAMEMAATGKAITAEEAYNFGLINKIVPEDKIDDEVRKLAESIARVPPVTNMFSKRAINNYFENLGIEQANRFGRSLMEMMEQSNIPGHYFDFFDLVRRKGVTEAVKEQRGKWGYPDEVMEREIARLRQKRGKV